MKKFYWLLLLGFAIIFTACNNDDDAFDNRLSPGEINSFIYRGLNAIYLFKDEAPDLANNRFPNTSERNEFILEGGSPEDFFERLTISQDRFSFIVDDFERLERVFQGTSMTSGLRFNEVLIMDTDKRYIVITDVVKDSPADKANIKRGMIFNRINGSEIDVNNRSDLFRQTTFTLGEAKFEGDILMNVENEITLTKVELTVNPIAATNIITDGSHKIGYLQYNSFVFNFEEQLNNQFSQFKDAQLTDFVLDLRYNGGGRVTTANALSGMLTGDFGGQIYSKRQWNSEIQQRIQAEAPEDLIDTFLTTTTAGTPLNSLRLKKLYVITSKNRTASASELVINSLKAYIDVVVIGELTGTAGKSQASRTVYDSPSLSRRNINPVHTYAMQPLIFRTVNKDNIGVPNEGIIPNIEAKEDNRNLGILGDPNEPLLKKAIDDITGRNTLSAKILNTVNEEIIGNEAMYELNFQRMYENP